MNPKQARFNMVEQQIRTWEVLDKAVLNALMQIQREFFVPADCQDLAYADTEIPLPHGQTMLPPRVDARLVNDLALTGTESVLEIGTGSGYLCALLALRARQVLSFEIHADLAQTAQRHLAQAGITNAQVRCADGAQGASKDGPFDAIVLGGSVSEVPQALLAQLAVGGRLIAIVGEEPVMQTTLFTRTAPQSWQTKVLWDTVAPALQGFAQPSAFHF
jgi:protein-L-isoaspartate(D-aspartate) O-methyltransferase